MDCAPLHTDGILTEKSIKLNGISGHIIFGTLLFTLVYICGIFRTIVVLMFLYLVALYIKKEETNRYRKKITKSLFYSSVKAGDTILVCRGGSSGISSDITELFLYFIIGTIASGSIMGHVGQVFMDNDGILKVTDVRHNSLYKSNNKHFICTVPEFIEEQYEGIKFWKPLKQPLSDEGIERLYNTVKIISDNTGHCHDCFNPLRVINTPTSISSYEEILEFGKKYGFGCAENIGFIQRIANIPDAPYNNFILPSHFENDDIFHII